MGGSPLSVVPRGETKKNLDATVFEGVLDGRLRFRVVRDSSSYMGTESAAKTGVAPPARARVATADSPDRENRSRIREAAANARSRASRSRRRARENAEFGVVIFPWGGEMPRDSRVARADSRTHSVRGGPVCVGREIGRDLDRVLGRTSRSIRFLERRVAA